MWETDFLTETEPGPHGVWRINQEASRYPHVAIWPRELVRQMILPTTTEGDIVLDPFAGSGTTGEVAADLGRKAILIESSKTAQAAMKDRIATKTSTGCLSDRRRGIPRCPATEGLGMAKQKKAKGSPFGETSRAELLEQHLDAFGEINAANAWRFVYEELLWFDRSTGPRSSLRKRQGASRTVVVVCAQHRVHGPAGRALFGVDRRGLKIKIDRLFLACLERLVEGKAKSPGAGLRLSLPWRRSETSSGIDPGVVEEAGSGCRVRGFHTLCGTAGRSQPNCWLAAPAWTMPRRQDWPARSLIVPSFT